MGGTVITIGSVRKIHTKHGIRCIRVGDLHYLILRCEDPWYVADLVPGCFEFRALWIHEVVIADEIVAHQRITVDIGFLCDSTGFPGIDGISCFFYAFFHLYITIVILIVINV